MGVTSVLDQSTLGHSFDPSLFIMQKVHHMAPWRAGKALLDRYPVSCCPHTPEPEDAFLKSILQSLEEGNPLWITEIFSEYLESPLAKVSAQYLDGFSQVFEKTEFGHLPEYRQRDHAIKLKPGMEPLNRKIYPFESLRTSGVGHVLEEHLHIGRPPHRIPPLFYYY